MAIFDLDFLAHGGDYNPDQWLEYPEVLSADIELMKKSGCNLMSVGIFAWAALEPEEGRYETGWLKGILDTMWENGISVLLATPSGARPAWMSEKYPEVLRVENDLRNHHGNRHNHCLTSPVYREKVRQINTRLAEEFGTHPAVKGWHISNEYSGECHCEYCQNAFREWLKERYLTLDNLNRAWWTSFWSKTFTSWSQLHSPVRNGESELTPLTLAWRRFVNDQTKDFVKNEIGPIRRICPDKPVCINTMGFFYGLDYGSFSDTVDFFGYDSYPAWGRGDDYAVAMEAGFTYDFVRGFGPQAWSLMESTPSQVNWQPVCKLKRPGMHLLSGIQAIAHGSDSVMMFQWRKSRGGPEKFHGAVVGHDGTGDTRVFAEVTRVGNTLKQLRELTHSRVKSEAALIFDQENRWALDAAMGPVRDKDYFGTLFEHYRALKKTGINVDVISASHDFSGYKLIAAPYLYLLKPGVGERLRRFMAGGGTLLISYMSGLVDEDDLCFLGGFPGELKYAAGVTNTETDALYPGQTNRIRMEQPLGALHGEYECGFICALLEKITAQTVGSYTADFYAGTPALTRNSFGKGECWYLAARPEQKMLEDLYETLVDSTGICRICKDLPQGVSVSSRVRGETEYVFYMNFNADTVCVKKVCGEELISGTTADGELRLAPLGFAVIRK